MIAYKIVHSTCWPLLKIFYKLKVYGNHNVPNKGGAIIAANHVSFFDPLILGTSVTHRYMFYMARESLFRIPIFGRLIRLGNALPVRQGVFTRGTLQWFESVVRTGQRGLLVFPEGTRSPDGQLGKPHRGIAAICRATRVPIIPVRIKGTYEVWPRWRRFPKLTGAIEVHFGTPVEWDEKELNATGDPNSALAALIMKRISNLDNTHEAPLGFWAGQKQILTCTFEGISAWETMHRSIKPLDEQETRQDV